MSGQHCVGATAQPSPFASPAKPRLEVAPPASPVLLMSPVLTARPNKPQSMNVEPLHDSACFLYGNGHRRRCMETS
jgi:hypothetical protein